MSYPPLELWTLLASTTALILILRYEIAREFKNTRDKIIQESENLIRDIMKELDRRVPSSQYPLKFEECSIDTLNLPVVTDDELEDNSSEELAEKGIRVTAEEIESIILEPINKTVGLPLPLIHSDFEFELRKDK